MSLDDFAKVKLARAIAEAGLNIPLNGVRDLDVDGVCDVLRRLAASRDEYATQARIAAAGAERDRWLRECSEKDVTRSRACLVDMTGYRDNAVKNGDEARRERDEARAALRQIANCGLKKCCKQCRETAHLYGGTGTNAASPKGGQRT